MAGEKILVVEDNPNIREVFISAFDEYDIVTASNGKDALGILNRPNDIDLIILDVVMPDMNGLELLEKMRRINKYSKVVIMTGYSSKDIAIEALRLSADEYIEKPFDINNVKDTLRKLLAPNQAYEKEKEKREKPDKITVAERLVRKNYNRPLSLKEISQELFLSYKYLSRAFKKRSGKSFKEFRLNLKLDSAKQLLRDPGQSVNEVAYRVGYHSPDSFMKIFKKRTGMTPTEYRRTKEDKTALSK
ncbi:MAG: response regulator [Candidatus Omnitrophica bacterium]|nr:response regulator [Candidatus Omnitrophota bacterium]MDD5552805.1 response regulator [Candidatus Omnitrophota bacterium]